MAVENGDAFLPGKHLIDAYGNGGFRFAGMSHQGSIIATASGIYGWAAREPADIVAGRLGPIFDAPRGSIELLLLGTGVDLVPVSEPLKQRLRQAGIKFDPMSSAAAARTYNVLAGEGRLVAAALLAVP